MQYCIEVPSDWICEWDIASLPLILASCLYTNQLSIVISHSYDDDDTTPLVVLGIRYSILDTLFTDYRALGFTRHMQMSGKGTGVQR